jgi:histidyl-tRNA synthetase
LEAVATFGYGDYVCLDLGIVRGLAYYTGFVFEVFERSSGGRALAGGGRYDTLMGRLCGVDMPAVGFAAGDVTFRNILTKKDKLHLSPFAVDVFVVSEVSISGAAMEDVKCLRQKHYSVDYPLSDTTVSNAFKKAIQSGARWILFYGKEGCGKVKVRDMRRSTESWVERTQLPFYLSREECVSPNQ